MERWVWLVVGMAGCGGGGGECPREQRGYWWGRWVARAKSDPTSTSGRGQWLVLCEWAWFRSPRALAGRITELVGLGAGGRWGREATASATGCDR